MEQTTTIKRESINEDLLDAAMESAGLPVTTGDVVEKAQLLQAHYQKSKTDAGLLTCDTCGGDSPGELLACPYCGDSGQTDEPAAQNDQSQSQETTDMSQPKGTKKTAKKSKAAKAPAAKKPKPEASTAIVPVSTPDGQKLVKTKGKGKSTKAEVVDAIVEDVKTEDLDAAVARIKELSNDVNTSAWELGQQLYFIHDQHLWQHRRDPKTGKAKFKTFTVFCTEELKMTGTQAFKWMDVAKAFTKDDVAKFGHSKLSLVVQVPPEERGRLLEGVERGGGKSRKELQDEVKKLKASGKKAPTGRETKAVKAMNKARAAKAIKEERIACSVPVAGLTVPLLARTTKGKEPKPARRMADQPHALIELPHGVVMKVHLITKGTQNDIYLKLVPVKA